MNFRKFICLFFLVLSSFNSAQPQERTKPVIHLGIMAFTSPESYTTYNKSDDYMLRELPRIIQANLPHYKIETKILRTHELVDEARKGKLDLIFGSSGCYASLLPDGIYPLATIATNVAPDPNRAVAGAFVVSSSRKDLNTIEDLKGKSAISGLRNMYFNYQLPLSALTDRKIDPENFFSNWERVDYPVNKVLSAVESGRKDVGLIRACSIEMLPKEQQKKFKVIEPVQNSPLHCLHTSRLFPNWTLGAMKWVPSDVATQISAALLTAKPETDMGIHWKIANSFSQIDDLYKSLKTGRYEYLNHWTLRGFMEKAWPFLLAGLVGLLGLILHLSRVQALVTKRTAQLKKEVVNRVNLERQNRRIVEKFSNLEKASTLGMISNMVAHELRQPLSALSYSLFTLNMVFEKEGISSEIAEKAISKAKKQVSRISSIVDHVYRYAKDDRRTEPLSLKTIIEQVVNEIKISNPSSVVHVHTEEDVLIQGNKLELQLALYNVLKNAIEASENGAAEINICLQREKAQAVLSVSDKSKSVSQDNLSKLTDEFHSSKAQGLGLGLPIVKSIVDNHGGSLKFKALEPRGLEVTFVFPIFANEH